MIKVLRIINRFNLGGPTYNAAYLTKYMSPEFKTLLIGGENDITEENSEYIVRNLGLRPIIIPEMRRSVIPKNDFIAYNKIREIIKRFKPDVVHTHASKAGALGRLAASSLKVPAIVHTFHGHVFDSYFGNFKTSFYKTIERKLANKTTKIIALCEQQRKELVDIHKICPDEKITIVPLGFDLQRFQENLEEKRKAFRNEYNIDNDELAIGIIGRIVPIKNHALFLDAIKKIKEQTNKKIRAFIVGDGEDMQKIQHKAAELNLDYVYNGKSRNKASITFTSWIKDIDYVNAGMDIIALTSLNEGTPVSLIEAQASNKPIVSTMAGGIENVVVPDKTALLSPINELEPFVQNLLLMVENEELRKNMSEAGWEHVKSKFHYTRLVNDMKALYYSLLS